jgi:hypothetical protein
MSLKWTQGSPDRMIATIQTTENLFTDTAVEIITESVQEGQALQREILDLATTPYGEERYSRGRGNSPGRNDTGNMIAEVTTGVEKHGNSAIGFWGWDNPDPHEDRYFEIQERTAKSLWGSFIPTREAFYRRFIKATRGF